MPKSTLETAIANSAAAFASQIVAAVRGGTLQELIALQGEVVAKAPGKKRGPKPGSKRGPKAGKGRKEKPAPKAAKASEPKTAKPKVTEPVAKKRVVRNFPKCAYPKCGKNRFVMGEGFCGEHFKAFKAGKIKAAGEYRK